MPKSPTPADVARLAVWPLVALLGGCCLTSPGPAPTAAAPVFHGAFTASTGPLRAGAASVQIILPNGTALAGFGSEPRRAVDEKILLAGGPMTPGGCFDPDTSTAAVFFNPATGTMDPLSARALVLDNGVRKIAIVKVDAIGMSRALRDAVAATGPPLGIPDAHVAVVATHTHSGPGGVSDLPAWEIAASDCYSAAVFAAVKSAAVLALDAANAALAPAKLGIGTITVAGVTRNRRNQPPLDTELALIKVTTAANAPLAALFNFAIHGTWYDASNMQFSADVMGAMEDAVEAALPGAVAIFTNGAEGDVAPQKSATLTTAAAVGNVVAAQVTALWNATPTSATVGLRAVFADVAMPAPQYNPAGCLPLAETDPADNLNLCALLPGGTPLTLPLQPSWVSGALPFQVLRINDTVLVAVPGEPVTELGTAIKQQAVAAGLTRGVVVAVANDHGGYFTTTAQYAQGTYEGTATLYGPTTGSTVVGAAGAVIDKVK